MVGIETKVTCPKCKQSFEYEFIPGGSFISVRFGRFRYMKCRMCGRWALFDITEGLSQSQRRSIGSSVVMAGLALAILGAAMVWTALSEHISVLEITGSSVFVVAVLIILLGLGARKRKMNN